MLSATIVYVLVIAFVAIAQDTDIEKLALYPLPSSDKVPVINSPGQTDDITWNMMTPCSQDFNRCAIGQIGNYVYLFGNYEVSNFGQAFNLTTESWENTTLPPIDGYNWVGVVANGSMYVYPKAYGVTSVQKFTPTGGGPTGTWAQVAPYPLQVGTQAVAWDGGNYIYLAGGTGYGGTTANTYKYDIVNDTYTQIASAPRTLKFSGGAFINGKFYAVNGLDANSLSTDDLYEYNPSTNTWTEKAPCSIPTAFSCWATTYNDFYIFIVGGGGGYSSWPAIDAVQVYDPETDSWFMETPRILNTGTNMALYCTGVNYLIDGGGYDGASSYSVIWKGLNPPGNVNELAPAAPTNFTLSHNNALLEATLDWINPGFTVNGQILTQLTGIKVFRDGDQIANLTNVQIGQPSTYDDSTVPSVGMYDYRIVGYNDMGDGLPAISSAWIGLDTPGAPGNLTATPDPLYELECTLEWNAPEQGAHNGYFPAGSWNGQKIYRDGALIADLAGTNTSYLDDNIPEPGQYYYGVSYYNSSGEGPITETPQVVIGPPDFEQIPLEWVEINNVGTNTGLTGDDQNVGPFPIGFDFPYYNGAVYNTIRICSNGFATFSSTATAYSNASIPSESQPNDLIAAYWDDLQCNVPGATVYYYYDAANTRFIIEWEGVGKYGVTGSSLTFEIIMYPSGDIDLNYLTLNSSTLNSATVGIENSDGTIGVQTTYNGSGPLEPQDNFAIRIYSVSPQIHNVSITLAPYNPPIQIPSNGGQFEFNIEVANNEVSPLIIDIWTMATLPNGSEYGPIINIPDFNTPASWTGNRDRTQQVPGTAPSGTYTYDAYVGGYPNDIWSEDHFEFEKLVSGDGILVAGWNNWGEDFGEGENGSEIIQPSEYNLFTAYPNPFNPSTTLSFDLSEAEKVSLIIYDVQGKEVISLVDGYKNSGSYEVNFDGSGLSSGIYFARLVACESSHIQKLLLIK